MSIGVNLSKRMPKGEQANGIDALAKPMSHGTNTEYVLLAVVPTKDIRARGDNERVIEVQIIGVEPLITDGHRRAAEKMLREARLARRGHEDQELPISD